MRKLCMLGYLLLLSTQCLAHESKEELEAIALVKQQQELTRQQQRDEQNIARKHADEQWHVAQVNTWKVTLSVAPSRANAGLFDVSVMVRDLHGDQPALSSVQLIQMPSVQKHTLRFEQGSFKATISLPQRQQSTMMLKIKTMDNKTTFVKFIY